MIPTTVVIFVDDMHLSIRSKARAIEALKDYVRTNGGDPSLVRNWQRFVQAGARRDVEVVPAARELLRGKNLAHLATDDADGTPDAHARLGRGLGGALRLFAAETL